MYPYQGRWVRNLSLLLLSWHYMKGREHLAQTTKPLKSPS